MYTFIVILITLIAIFMTIAILMQSGQGSGLSGGLAGNAAGCHRNGGTTTYCRFSVEGDLCYGRCISGAVSGCQLLHRPLYRNAISGSAAWFGNAGQ